MVHYRNYRCPPSVPILNQFDPVHDPHPTSCKSILILSSHLCLGLRPRQRISPGLRHLFIFHNYAIFYGEELLALRPTPKLEDQPLVAVCDCLFNIVTQHNGDCSSMCNLRTHQAVVTGNHLSWLHSVYSEKAKTGNTPISQYESMKL